MLPQRLSVASTPAVRQPRPEILAKELDHRCGIHAAAGGRFRSQVIMGAERP